MRDRIKRILAFVIDWNIILFPCVFCAACIAAVVRQPSSLHPTVGSLFLILAALAAIVFRDVLFKGRSLGKRIFGLYVYDKKTLQEPSLSQRTLRNVFFFLYLIDGIILLSTGESIGDRAAGTVVLSQKPLDVCNQAPALSDHGANGPAVPQKTKSKKAIKAAAIAAGCLIAFIGLILIVLNAKKDTEEYKLAYHYLISSDAFEELDADPSQVWMNQYSSTTYSSADHDPAAQTVEIGFIVNFRSFQVVCHKENGIWFVCDDCTPFD